MGTVIIGAGNWGSTLAGLVNPAFPVRMWCRSPESVEPARQRVKTVAGTDRIQLTIEPAFSSPLAPDDIVIFALPSSQVRTVAKRVRESMDPPYPPIVSTTKGLERATFRTMSQVISAAIPEARVAVLSGPNIAPEIAAGRPAKAVLGCEDVHVLLRAAKAIGSDRFHLEMTRDKVDLELCAAMKGVFAIGSGIIAERKWGSNTVGLLLTFGMREIREIARFLGIRSEHVLGVAGLGDLVATCFSPDSRNFRLGRLLARGVPLREALDQVEMVVEGAMTASAVAEMTTLRLNLPMFKAIARIVEDPSEENFQHFDRVLFEYPGAH